jgi:hypothetical protein
MDKPRPVPSPGGLGREEGIEHLFPHFKGNAAAVVANRDLDAVAKVLRRSRKSRLKAFTLSSCSLRLLAA